MVAVLPPTTDSLYVPPPAVKVQDDETVTDTSLVTVVSAATFTAPNPTVLISSATPKIPLRETLLQDGFAPSDKATPHDFIILFIMVTILPHLYY